MGQQPTPDATLPTPSTAFWRGRRVLVTGHTGFKGSWLALWLMELGAEVTGLSNGVPTARALYDDLGLGPRRRA